MNHQASLSLSTFRYSAKDFGGGHPARPWPCKQKKMKTMEQRDQRQAEDVGPAEGDRQARGEQRGQRGARVAGAGNAHRRALMLGGYQREASGSAAAKEAPATPRKRPRISTARS
jgi:hypothetical protein